MATQHQEGSPLHPLAAYSLILVLSGICWYYILLGLHLIWKGLLP